MPILIALLAGVVSLFLTGSARVGPIPSGLVPAVEWVNLLLLAAMCVASALLRHRHRLFALSAVLFGVDAVLTLVMILVDPSPFAPARPALWVFAVEATIGIVGQVLFLLAMAQLCARVDVLRIGFRVLAGCVTVTGVIQTMFNVGTLFATTAGWVFEAATRVQTIGYSDFLLVVDAAILVLLASAWFRVARPA